MILQKCRKRIYIWSYIYKPHPSSTYMSRWLKQKPIDVPGTQWAHNKCSFWEIKLNSLFNFFIWVYVFQKDVLASAVQWSESAICWQRSPPLGPLSLPLSHPPRPHRARSWAPCTTHQVSHELPVLHAAVHTVQSQTPNSSRYCQCLHSWGRSKPQWGITSHQAEWLSSKKQTTNAGEAVEKRESSCTVDGNINW